MVLKNIYNIYYDNTSNIPKNINHVDVNYDVIYRIYKFLKNYSNIRGLLLPRRNFNKISILVVFLLISYSYMSVHCDYIQVYKNEYEKKTCVIAKSTFCKIWKSLILSFQFILLKSNLCRKYETIKLEIQYTTQNEKKLLVTENYYLTHLNHIKQKHNYYNANITYTIVN